LLAEALAGAGEFERARLVADEAEAASLHGGERPFECFSCLAIVRARRQVDARSMRALIEATLARVERLVAASGAHLYSAWVHEERAALAARLDDNETQQRELAEARRLFTAMGADRHAARLG
jgi:hypothetical protein